ncbi:MAG: proton-conducting transporter membrane subunit, partial [Anaerolineales bacterium]
AVHAFFKALLFLGAGSVAHGLEHGAMGEEEDADPQDIRAMGGLARRMPLTFAAFLAGALSLAGFPLLTAGFWSKDGILSAAQHASPVLFLALAAASLLTACYVGRILALVFLGAPRSPAARNAAEPSRWMLAPALVLAVPAVAAGWAGIPEDFPLLGGLVPDGIAGLLGAEGGSFNGAALAVSILAPSAGLFLGWMAYRGYAAGRKDPLQILLGPAFGFLQAGCRFDDLYQILFVRPARWIADVAVSEWIDRRILDGMLRAAWKGALSLGRLLRDAVDLPVINGAADRIGRGTRRAGSMLRIVQSGRVQEYLMIGLTVFVAAAAMLIWSMLAGP